MKILHTSDWHIGREFANESLAPDQESFLRWLAEVVRDRGVDVVVVAGDIYDKASPKPDAIALLDRGLRSLCDAGARVVLISGNHDNAIRLGFGAERQEESGVFIKADDLHHPEPFVLTVGTESVAVVAIPFLDPQRAPEPRPAADGSARKRTHHHVLEDACDVARERLAARGLTRLPTLAIAHAYVAGAAVSDSEKHTVGGTDLVGAEVFHDFDYVALGHLHRPQIIDNDERLAYSGTPLPYSYSEQHAKSVRLVNMDAGGLIGVEVLAVPNTIGRPVVVLTDTIEHLLADERYERWTSHWVSVKLTNDTHVAEPMQRLRQRFPFITELAYVGAGSDASGSTAVAVDVQQRAPHDLVWEFFREQLGRELDDDEALLLRQSLERAEVEA
jgi:exonuclease SbcD